MSFGISFGLAVSRQCLGVTRCCTRSVPVLVQG
uniref:Uncharacterized protein n=1 Tax=Anopheles minimus TaxID=112268 RepID=A0A182WMV6_9DIPT